MSQQPNHPVGPNPAAVDIVDGQMREAQRNPVQDASLETISLMEETLQVTKRDVVTGTVRVSTRTAITKTTADITLERTTAEVTRVPVGRLVEEPPAVRTEGDVTIVPIFEERYVVVKQLYLTEELHIRHRVQPVVSHLPVQLRRQTAVVERLDADGRLIPEDDGEHGQGAAGAA